MPAGSFPRHTPVLGSMYLSAYIGGAVSASCGSITGFPRCGAECVENGTVRIAASVIGEAVTLGVRMPLHTMGEMPLPTTVLGSILPRVSISGAASAIGGSMTGPPHCFVGCVVSGTVQTAEGAIGGTRIPKTKVSYPTWQIRYVDACPRARYAQFVSLLVQRQLQRHPRHPGSLEETQ